jgi:Protein of unknown function (DUF1616)
MSRRAALIVAAAAVVAAAAALWPTPAAVRVPAGLLLALVLPGIALTGALFGGRVLSTVERLVLPPALSAAVLVVGGLGLYAAGVTLGRVSWTALTAGTTVLASAAVPLVGRLRRHRADPQSVTETAMFGTVLVAESERLTVRTAFWRLVPLALALLLVTGAAALAIRGTAAGRQPFTALSLVPAADSAPAQPNRRPVVLTVRCEENGAVGYALRVAGDDGYQQTFTVTLQPGGTWTRTLQVPVTGTVTADLFMGTTAVPYRTVHLAGGR